MLNRLVPCALALGALLSLPNHAGAVDVFIEYRQYDNGVWEVDVISREDQAFWLIGAVVNQSQRPECNLTPYAGSSGAWLARSDLNTVGTRAGVQISQRMASIRMERGQIITATIPQQCGYLLDIRFLTEHGDAFFVIE